VKELKDDK